MTVRYSNVKNGLPTLTIPKMDHLALEDRVNIMAVQNWCNNLQVVVGITAGANITLTETSPGYWTIAATGGSSTPWTGISVKVAGKGSTCPDANYICDGTTADAGKIASAVGAAVAAATAVDTALELTAGTTGASVELVGGYFNCTSGLNLGAVVNPCTVTGEGRYTTIIKGNVAVGPGAFVLNNTTVNFQDLTIEGNLSITSPYASGDGACDLENCLVTGNISTSGYVFGGTGPATITAHNCTFAGTVSHNGSASSFYQCDFTSTAAHVVTLTALSSGTRVMACTFTTSGTTQIVNSGTGNVITPNWP